MKFLLYIYLAFVTALSVAEADDNVTKIEAGVPVDPRLDRKAKILMAGLKVKEADGKELPSLAGALSEKSFNQAGKLVVGSTPLEEDRFGNLTQKLGFADEKDKIKGVAIADVWYAKSAKDAQLALFRKKAESSKPLDGILRGLVIISDGPGDLCFLRLTRDQATGEIVGDKSTAHFIRDNVAVRFYAAQEGVNTLELAKIIDEKLLEESKGFDKAGD